MPKQNTPLTFVVAVAGTYTDWQYFDPCTRWGLRNCAGNVSIEVDKYPIMTPCVAGQQETVPRKFKRMRITSDQAETVVIHVGDDPMSDSRKLVAAVGGVTPVQTQLGVDFQGGNVSLAAGAATLISTFTVAQNIHGILLSLDPDSPGPVRIQPNASTNPTDQGVWLWPGQQLRLLAAELIGGTTLGLQAFNPAGNLVAIRLSYAYEAS